MAPSTVRYVLHDGRLETRAGDRELVSIALRDTRLVIATPTAAFAFRHAVSSEPIAILRTADLVETLASEGATIERVDGPVARYGEWTALPSATVR